MHKLEINGANEFAETPVSKFVYQVVKNNIMNFNFVPLQRISENEISKALNVSRTPVRESFIRLKEEGLLNILSQRGTYVSKIDLSNINEVVFIRESLELAAIKKAIRNDSEELINLLSDILQDQKEAIRNNDYKQFLKVDDFFHKSIFESLNMGKVWDYIKLTSQQYDRIRILDTMGKDECENLLKEHVSIYDAINSKDIDLAEENLKKHLETILEKRYKIKQRYPEYFV